VCCEKSFNPTAAAVRLGVPHAVTHINCAENRLVAIAKRLTNSGEDTTVQNFNVFSSVKLITHFLNLEVFTLNS